MVIKKGVNEMNENTEEKWFVAYDLKSEFTKNLKTDEKKWIETKRVSIWYALRYKYGCVPIQKSLWLVRDKKKLEKIKQDIERWKGEYEERGISVLLEIFSAYMDEKGISVIENFEFELMMEWIGKIFEKLDKMVENDEITNAKLNRILKRVELIEIVVNEDFKTHERYDEIMDLIQEIQNRVFEYKNQILEEKEGG